MKNLRTYLLLVCLITGAICKAQTFPIINTVLANSTRNIVSSGLVDSDILTFQNTGLVSLRFCLSGSASTGCGNAGIMVNAGSTVTVTVAQLGGVSTGTYLNGTNTNTLIVGNFKVDKTAAGCIPLSSWVSSCTTESGSGIVTQFINTTANVRVGYTATTTNAANLFVNGAGNFSGNLSLGAFNALSGDARLSINGGALFTTSNWHKAIRMDEGLAMVFSGASSQFGMGVTGNQLYIFKSSTDAGAANNIIKINANGSVGIGTDSDPDPDYKLSVNGTIRGRKIKLDLTWADYVFAKDYKLMNLNELEAFINKNGHLPEIPAASEIEKNGGDVSELLQKQMQKIEELTLYIIQQQKEIEALKSEIKK